MEMEWHMNTNDLLHVVSYISQYFISDIETVAKKWTNVFLHSVSEMIVLLCVCTLLKVYTLTITKW